jgi:SAM-dependent methyltransferase
MSILLKKPTELLKEFLNDYSKICPIDIELANKMIKDDFKYYKEGGIESVSSKLEKQWYESLEKSNPDYSVYSYMDYYVDVWCCWVMYSRSYIKVLQSNNTLLKYNTTKSIVDVLSTESKSVIDLGCGVGYSTAGLKEIFPNNSVYGYNIGGTHQYKFNEFLANKYGFSMTDDYTKIGQIDTVFASEYFEHFERPMEHLEHVVKTLNPTHLIIANSFNTKSIGHFIDYKHENEVINQKYISKRFNKRLKELGYVKLKPKIFNNKPSLFVKINSYLANQ